MPDVSPEIAPRVLDVRPMLQSGGEPFQAVMLAVQDLRPGQGLKLLVTFRPQPLFRVMEERGFDHEAREIEGGDWEVLFTPQQAAALVDISVDADRPETWPDPCEHLDLSDLDPPEPMVRILAAAEALEPGDVLFAVLAREPLFLFPELSKRGYQWAGNLDEKGSAYRILVRIGETKVSRP